MKCPPPAGARPLLQQEVESLHYLDAVLRLNAAGFECDDQLLVVVVDLAQGRQR